MIPNGHLAVLLLNTRKRVKGYNLVSIGTMDTILVHPREVFRVAIVTAASAVIVMHNHPSGESTLSEADIKVSRDLIRAGQLLKLEVLDHVIIGNGNFSSLRALVISTRKPNHSTNQIPSRYRNLRNGKKDSRHNCRVARLSGGYFVEAIFYHLPKVSQLAVSLERFHAPCRFLSHEEAIWPSYGGKAVGQDSYLQNQITALLSPKSPYRHATKKSGKSCPRK